MGALVGLEEPRPRDMRVALGGRDGGVTQQLLHGADVGSPFEQVCRERMPQGVWRDPTPRQQTSRISFHKRSDIAGTDRPAFPIEEERRRARGQVGPALPQPLPDGLDRRVGHRNLAFLRTLSHHEDPSSRQVHAADGEPRDLAHAQT